MRALPQEGRVTFKWHLSVRQRTEADLAGVIPLWWHVTDRCGLYATRSSAVPCVLGFTTISTSCPSATRKRMRRSTEYPRN